MHIHHQTTDWQTSVMLLPARCSCGCRKIRGPSRKIRGPSRPRVSWHTACTELGNHPRMGSLVARGARCPEAPSQLFGPEAAACASPWRNDEAHRCAHPGPTEPPRARDSRQESMHRVRSGWLWSSMRRPGNPRLDNERSSHSEYAICAIPSICPARSRNSRNMIAPAALRDGCACAKGGPIIVHVHAQTQIKFWVCPCACTNAALCLPIFIHKHSSSCPNFRILEICETHRHLVARLG